MAATTGKLCKPKAMPVQSGEIRKAVIPVAGLGTRFLPVTRSVPKALLPVMGTPLIHYAVDEAAECGIDTVVLVISPGMESVAAYFDARPDLETALESSGRRALLEQQRQINDMADIVTVTQPEPRGLGHAVYLAHQAIGSEHFAVILPDDFIRFSLSALGQLLEVHRERGGSVLAARAVPDEVVPTKGIIDAEPLGNRVHRVRGLVEKPPLDDAPGNLSIIGRYVLGPGVFDHLAHGTAGAGGEIQLTDAIAATIGADDVFACEFEGTHNDVGEPKGMLLAALQEARSDPDLRANVLDAVSGW